MQNDNEFPVTYKCECGARHTIAGISPRRISADFETLGWLNMEVAIGEKVDYVTVCPDCATAYYDEALEMEGEQQADNDYFLGGGQRW